MRFKNFTLLFLMGIFGLFTTNLFAQHDATIDPADIRYWIGEGENEAVFIVNWNSPDTALAWGYRFNEETILVKEMMEKIADIDSRFDFLAAGGMVEDITFNDGILDLSLSGMYWLYNVNGTMASYGFEEQTVADGDYVKWGDESCATEIQAGSWNFVWTKEVAPVYPIASDATISPDDILFWVGEGQHQVVFIVNWNNPNMALAWGYRFDGDTVVVKEVMDAIAASDSRFGYEAAGTMVTDLTYNYGDVSLSLAGMYWLLNVNGTMAWYGFDEQTVADGDYVKWGDESCATEIAQWTYVWEQPVEPVSNTTGIEEGESLTVSVYPNPAVGEAWVNFDGVGETAISVFDMQGRLVNVQSINAIGETNVRIETSRLSSGVYYVAVRDANATKTLKLVVK